MITETKKQHKFLRLLGAVAVIAIMIVLLAVSYGGKPSANRPIRWGATFSQKAADFLGIDWKENYRAIIGDLNIKDIRLVAYWDLIEPSAGKFDFAGLDYQMDLADKNGVKVIMAIGQKEPRWPECHFPEWAKQLSSAERNDKTLEFLKAVVLRYKDYPNLIYFQVENEPYLSFGECPLFNKNLIDEEINLAKSIDPDHQILTTDSGELGIWYKTAKKGDVFGTTMYRKIYNNYTGYFTYPLPPLYFRIKEKIIRFLTGDFAKKYIVIELAAEPWTKNGVLNTLIEEQLKLFSLDFFKDSIKYAKATGFEDYYLWGAEWWYWLKTKQNHPEYWEYAKEIINSK